MPASRYFFATLITLLFGGVLSAERVSAECSDATKDVVLRTVLADASTFANLRGSADSVKVKSLELLNEGIQSKGSQRAPEGFCAEGCKAEPEVIFASVPNKFKSDSSDEAVCNELLSKTTAQPILFSGREFPNLKELNGYFGKLCQGSGADGEALYKECHSSCSPQYTSSIQELGSSYKMNTSVVCGPARDKSDGMYRLSVSYRWHCLPS